MQLTVFHNHIYEAMKQENLSLKDVADKVIAHGITGIEMDFNEYLAYGGDSHVKELRAAGIPVSSVYRFYNWETWGAGSSYKETIQVLGRNNIPHHMAIPGFYPSKNLTDAQRAKLDKRMMKVMSKLCKLADKRGIQIHIEDFDDALSPIATSDGMIRFLDAEPLLTPCFDTGNFLYSEEDALLAFEVLKGRSISYVHCKDRSFDVKENEEPKATVKGRDMYSSPVGKGAIPMKELLLKLKEIGYDGVFAIEHFGSQHMLDDMLASADFINNLWNS